MSECLLQTGKFLISNTGNFINIIQEYKTRCITTYCIAADISHLQDFNGEGDSTAKVFNGEYDSNLEFTEDERV